MIPSRLRLSLVDGELVVCRLPEGANVPTPADGGRLRVREVLTGVGGRAC